MKKIVIVIAIGLLQVLSVIPFADENTDIFITDAIIRFTLTLIALTAIKSVAKYGIKINKFQQIVNIIGLLIAFLIFVVGGAYFVNMLIFDENTHRLLPFIGVNIFITSLIFSTIYLLYSNVNDTDNHDYNEEEPINRQVESSATDYLQQINVKSGQQLHIFPLADVLFLHADGDYVQVHTAQGKFLKEQTMKYFEENLPPSQFVRIHRSVIVNTAYISRIERYGKQAQILTLKNGERLKTSAAGYQILKTQLGIK